MEKIKKTCKLKPSAVLMFFVGLVGVPLLFGRSYFMLPFCYLTFYTIAVSGIDVLVGYSGQMSMGHAAYLCIGAYASAALRLYTGVPVILCMVFGALVATVIGTLLAWPATKLVNHFQSLSTIAFAAIVQRFVKNTKWLGAAIGFSTEPISLFGIKLDTYIKYYIFMFLVMVLFLLVKSHLVNSRTGRAMIAIRENAHAADGMGINVRKYKILAFSVSAFFTGFAGAAYVHLIKYAVPDSFAQTVSVMLITMLLFGGSASLAGPIIGAGSVLALNELLRNTSRYQVFVYGCILLLIIVGMPGGLVGAFHSIRAKGKAALQKKKDAGGESTNAA